MKKLNTFLLIFVFVCSVPVWAQETKKDTLSVSSKIDSIYTLQKKMYLESKNQPLADKKFGLEFNVFRLLMIDEAVTLSGGFSMFDANRHAEIAFPVYYGNPQDQKDLTELTIDCHFRYFLGNTQNGFYLSGFARYAHLDGYLGDNDLTLWEDKEIGRKSTEDKFGLGVGIGYRKFSYRGLYWGTSLNFGRYFMGNNEKFFGDWLSIDDDQKYILDFEFLKFGYAF